MKKILCIATLLCAFMVLAAFTTNKTDSIQTEMSLASDYCDGWKEGYCEGWRDVKGQLAICPITPICPIPEINKTRYKDGYNRGFKAGSKAAKK